MALIGAGGHGLSHRRKLQALADRGRIVVAGLCDRQPITPDPSAPLDGVPFFTDHRELLTAVRPGVVIICTPPHTHLPIALDSLAAGADLLLEKPPVTSLDEHRRLTEALRDSGRACQVGFQALGSAALAQLRAATDGDTGPVAAAGAWWRPDTYYQRAPWAGRQAAFDGALVNPFAHALMQALAVAGPSFRPAVLELERYRSRPIETDDTTFLRLTGAGGRQLTAAVTLASEIFVRGEIHCGGAVLEYPTDRLRLPGDTEARHVAGRTDLLENLIEHRAAPGVPLLAPLAVTETFTAVAEAVVAAPPPAAIPGDFLTSHPDGGGRVVTGIDELVHRVAGAGRLPSELGVPWAVAPHRMSVSVNQKGVTHAQTQHR